MDLPIEYHFYRHKKRSKSGTSHLSKVNLGLRIGSDEGHRARGDHGERLSCESGGLIFREPAVAKGEVPHLLSLLDQTYFLLRERRQAFGQRSREFLASLVAAQQVEVETEKTDKYGRSVGKVLLQGRDVNLAVVAAGLAWHYKEYESEQCPADRLLYSNAEQEARDLRKGLWVDPAPEAPWDWRHNGRGQ